MKLSQHFTLDELTRSGTADRLNLDNAPGPGPQAALQRLVVNLLEPLRGRAGRLKVTSGYRSPAVNAAVGSTDKSQHLLGEAADVLPLDMTRDELLLLVWRMVQADELDVDQVITYTGKPHLHLSYTSVKRNRSEFLVCTAGKKYRPWTPETE